MKKLLAFAAATVLAVSLAGCSDDKADDTDGKKGDDPVALLTEVKKTIDEAASIHLVITGRDLPDTGQVLASGDGVATHAPAFKGKLTVRSSGSPIDAEVVAVGSFA
jgi:lipoprotein LprG